MVKLVECFGRRSVFEHAHAWARKGVVMSKVRVTEADAKQAIREYDPQTDFRVWQELSRLWTIVAGEFVELAAGYCQDGKSISELLHRLREEMKKRLDQQESSFQSAVEKFEHLAYQSVYDSVMDARIESINLANRELEQARAEAVGRAAAADAKRREDRYQADLKEAERRRAGGVTNPAFFG